MAKQDPRKAPFGLIFKSDFSGYENSKETWPKLSGGERVDAITALRVAKFLADGGSEKDLVFRKDIVRVVRIDSAEGRKKFFGEE